MGNRSRGRLRGWFRLGVVSHEVAQYRAYRWAEDGLLGWTDRQCRLCVSISLWDGGFLGLGNIGVFDCSEVLPDGVTLKQTDAMPGGCTLPRPDTIP